MTVPYSVVVPTVGRSALTDLLRSLATCAGPRPERVVVVDDRPGDLPALRPPDELGPTTVVRSGGRGPAAARNAGWVRCDTDWIVFLDDDVRVGWSWAGELAADLDRAGDRVAGVQARIEVPLPAGRRPNDAERGTAGLASARWITADMAFRRADLAFVGGFDERFPRAFREDADLALRLLDAGRELTVGERRTVHPVAPGRVASASVRAQRGNADDALMRRLHGPDWYERVSADRGRLRAHLATTAIAGAGLTATCTRRRRTAALAAAGWAAATAHFAAARIAPGPRNPREVLTMLGSSVVIPPLAVWHRGRGELRHRRARPWRDVSPIARPADVTVPAGLAMSRKESP